MRGRQAMLAGGIMVALGLSAPAAASAGSAWTPAPVPEAANAKTTVQAKRFSSFALDRSALANALEHEPAVIQVPAPGGRLQRFAVSESPVLQRRIARRNPQIRTYAGQGVDDPSASIRLDLTPLGFHASVFSERGAWYVDPYSFPERGVYASYFKRDLPASARPEFAEGELAGAGSDLLEDMPKAERRGGAVVQRTYRTAIANDPAYADFFGGGDANVLAAKTTMINRLNQVYNDDLAVKLVLINETNALNFETEAEYSDANGPCGAAPCYTPFESCSGQLLFDNGIALGQIVGASDYDVGHIVLGVDGGGIAGLGVVGASRKGEGCTGTSQPVNDPFVMDYVAHELGHQFGSDHTFNGEDGACGGNRAQSTSVEPGSGSTIMSYAGICSADDLQPLVDAFFSQRSIEVITDYISGAEPDEEEVQMASLSGFGGTDSFRIAYGGNNSAVITNGSNYTAAGIESAIEGIAGWPAGAQVFVSGYGGDANPSSAGFQVLFAGSLSGVDAAALSIQSPSGFTGFFGEYVQGGPADNGGATATTGNAAPAVTAPANETIPVRTPFELTGQGTDADGDPLVYTWEQNNNGGGSGIALFSNSKPNGPLFRMGSVASAGAGAATSSPTRVFPDYAQIAAGNTNAATGSCPASDVTCFSEFLPTPAYAAQMNFRLTARDRTAEGGGTGFDDMTLTLADSAGPFRVTSHASSATLTGGTTTNVMWNVAGTSAAPVSAANVAITFSADGGLTYPTVLEASTANDGSATVIVPNIATTQGRFKVKAADNVFFDISDANVTVNPGSGNIPPVLAAIGNKNATVGNQLSFQISATDSDADPLTYSASNLPAGANFNPSNRTFTWTPTAPGTFPNVHFEVDDGTDTDSEDITITVTEGGDTDPPETTIEDGPNKDKIKLKKGKKKAKVTYEYGSDEDPVTFECNVNSEGFEECSQTTEYKLKKGEWTLEARAVDAAGNVDETPVSDTITIKKKKRN